jgi:dipeptidyl-peptidase-4
VQGSDVYRCAISEVPGYDSRGFTLHEVYMGMPADNAEIYDNADVLRLAPQLKGDLLMIGGANDTATQKELFRMSENLIRLGIPHEQFTFPNSGHGALGASGRYNNDMRLRWFQRHLQS